MEFNFVQLAELVIVFMFLVAIVSFFLAKKKSNSPIKAALMGFVFSIVPVMGIAYLIYLYSRDDITESKTSTQ
ncbi:MAG: hypothetical protein ACSHW0_17835 [Thalassotalea sp.]